MVAIAFDTLAYSKILQAAGMPPELATKHDLHVALSETKHELLKWIMGMLVAQSALLVAVMAFIK